MTRKFILAVTIAVSVVGCATYNKVEKTDPNTHETSGSEKDIQKDISEKEKGLSRLSESLQAKRQKRQQAAEKLSVVQKEIDTNEDEVALIRESVENTKAASKEMEMLQISIDSLVSSAKRDQDVLDVEVNALRRDVDTTKNQITLSSKRMGETIQVTEKEKNEAEAQMKILEEEILERQKAYRSTKARMEATLLATEKEQQDTEEKNKQWNNLIRDKEEKIVQLNKEFDQTKKIKDSKAEMLNSKMEIVQRRVSPVPQKIVEIQK